MGFSRPLLTDGRISLFSQPQPPNKKKEELAETAHTLPNWKPNLTKDPGPDFGKAEKRKQKKELGKTNTRLEVENRQSSTLTVVVVVVPANHALQKK